MVDFYNFSSRLENRNVFNRNDAIYRYWGKVTVQMMLLWLFLLTLKGTTCHSPALRGKMDCTEIQPLAAFITGEMM
jgi:hypothetical protein